MTPLMEKEQKDLGKIDNFYTIKYKLGEGGFGTVYLVNTEMILLQRC